MKHWWPLAVGILLITCAASAQSGCTDSPECPTAILGLVGSVGAALYIRLRR